MDFHHIDLPDRPLLTRYFSLWGEGSCQHSFVSMFCLQCKYSDELWEHEGWLYLHRAGRDRADARVYLAPMGDPADREGLAQAIRLMQDDAHSHGARLELNTVTETMAKKITELFPGVFEAKELRDYSEYIYSYEKLAELPGHEMASKRHDVSAFYRSYGDRVEIRLITPDMLDQVRAFQEKWLTSRTLGEDRVQLELESQAIALGLDRFSELGLSGIAVYIDGAMEGYAYGAPLSDTHYDVLIEKGDRAIPDIYRILNQELVRRCCQGFGFINREEDLGVPGLRKAKMSYKPDLLLKKYVLSEVTAP